MIHAKANEDITSGQLCRVLDDGTVEVVRDRPEQLVRALTSVKSGEIGRFVGDLDPMQISSVRINIPYDPNLRVTI